MEEMVIYGAGNTGKSAYFLYKNSSKYKVLFCVDSDKNKWGKVLDDLPIKSPAALKDLRNVQVLIASMWWQEIIESLKEFEGLKISIYKPQIHNYMRGIDEIAAELNKRTIDLGVFIRQNKEIVCKELTFIPGGSGILDYVFLKSLAEKYKSKVYLEIGTYIGESINILTDCCEKLYSITASQDNEYGMDSWCQRRNLPDYSERLAYNDKIIHFYGDSKCFDYSKIVDDIDLFFIDGDHSYEGVYSDTKNIFNMKKENAIVVWHDFRTDSLSYREELVMGVKDALGDKFQNVYVTNGNLCGIYIPEKYIKDFELRELKYNNNDVLYTYDIKLMNYQIK